MNNPSTDVLITNVELKPFETSSQYKIIGNTTSGVMRFKFYDKKKDGTYSSAFEQFQSMNLKIGDMVNIAYSEEEREYQGKPYTDRRVIWFRETNTPASSVSATPASSQTESPHGEANRGQSEASGRNWDKEAYEKCCSLWIASKLRDPNISHAELIGHIKGGVYFELFQAIKADGDKRFSPLRQAIEKHAPQVVDREMIKGMTNVIEPGEARPTFDPELPTIQVADDVQEMADQMAAEDWAKDIPF